MDSEINNIDKSFESYLIDQEKMANLPAVKEQDSRIATIWSYVQDSISEYWNWAGEMIENYVSSETSEKIASTILDRAIKTYGPELLYAAAATGVGLAIGGIPALLISTIALPMIIPTAVDKAEEYLFPKTEEIQQAMESAAEKVKAGNGNVLLLIENGVPKQIDVDAKIKESNWKGTRKEWVGYYFSQLARTHGRKVIGICLSNAMKGLGPGIGTIAQVGVELLITPMLRDEVLAPLANQAGQVAAEKTGEFIQKS